MQGAGGVYSTIDDMAKYVQLHLNSGKLGEEEFISPSILEEMYTIPFPAKAQIHGYALGIDTTRKYDSLFLFHHGGGYGYLANMAWYQDLGIGIVILTNSADHNLQGKLYNQILDKILHPRNKINQKAPAKDIIVEPTIEALRKLSGNYVGKEDTMELVFKEDALCRKNGNEFIPFVFYSENEAYLDRDRYYYYRFEINENGFPDYLIRLNNGRTWDYNDGPNDPPGPDKPEWENYTGTYNVYVGGNLITTARLEMKNGYLYISYLANSERLKEVKQGTFVTCKGEILLLGERNTFASIFELVKK
jgi:CubicO group peptidase (beta-lactamase class C family)